MFLFEKLEKGAEFSAVYPDGGTKNTFAFEGAVKYLIFEVDEKFKTSGFIVSEWRRNTTLDKEQNTLFIAFSTQSLMSDTSSTDGISSLGSFQKPYLKLAKNEIPIVLNYYSSLGFKRDYLTDRNSGFFDLSTTLTPVPKYEKDWLNLLFGIKYQAPVKLEPSMGVQYEGNYLAIDSPSSGSVVRFAAGINIVISPINPLVKLLGFQDLKFQYSYYSWDDLYEAREDDVDFRDWYKQSITLVYDKNVSFSAEFIQGTNPLEGYEQQNQIKFSFRGKMN